MLSERTLLKRLRKISHRNLVRAHNRLFLRSLYYKHVTRHTPRHQIEARIWQLYQLRKVKNDAPFRSFLRARLLADSSDMVDIALGLVASPGGLSPRTIEQLDKNTVDACLAVLGYGVDSDLRVRRRVLYLYFHGKLNRLATRKRPRIGALVRKQLAKNPSLTYRDYEREFRDKHPHISYGHFRNIKYHWTRRGRRGKRAPPCARD